MSKATKIAPIVVTGQKKEISRLKAFAKKFSRNKVLLIMFLPTLIYMILFRIIPMYGVVISFLDYNLFKGISGSEFVGLKYFQQFISSRDFWILLRNTFLLGIFRLSWTFPVPIILALIINEIRTARIKKMFQTVTYLPYFISSAVVVSMIIMFLAPTGGLVNNLIASLGGERINFMLESKYFRTLYIGSEVWQTSGYFAIIYLAALTGINPELYESAIIDGANKYKQIIHITLPGIMTTIIVMFILAAGNIVSIGFDKVFLLQNAINVDVSDIISTFVYRVGISQFNYSYATAAGLFQSVIALIFVFAANQASNKISDIGIL
jgi:putative aldouronate transport system permease protein